MEIKEAQDEVKDYQRELKFKIDQYKQAVADHGKGSTQADQARKDAEQFDKDYLQNAKAKLARLRNLGEAQYADIMSSRSNRWYNSLRFTYKTGVEKAVKASEKQWAKDDDKKH